ncbi:MAG: YheV family putative metal-binding protein [Gammaproteobacteria bacterium]|nr:MAG: YheV family putative metal-binding protein [Gammaproteobacteria bacterium]
MAYSTKRRFMAGAVCPRCSQMDSIVVYNLDGKDFRECVKCDFKEEMRLNIATSELDTRVNHKPDHETVQVINILPLDSSDKK